VEAIELDDPRRHRAHQRQQQLVEREQVDADRSATSMCAWRGGGAMGARRGPGMGGGSRTPAGRAATTACAGRARAGRSWRRRSRRR
jgi:hypothetical protein